MGEYVYRTQEKYENGNAIMCKNPNSNITIDTYIKNGSRIGSRFISTTKKISIAKYKYSQGENKRNPIILIDFKKLKELKDKELKDKKSKGEKSKDEMYIYDFVDDETLVELLNRLTVSSRNFVKADREVTIVGDIPAECCKKIPPLIADILSAFELDGQMRVLINPINDMIMDNSINAEMEKILGKIEFNDLEEKFIKEYYSDSMPTLEAMGKSLFPEAEKSDMIAQCLQLEVLKKIFRSNEFKEFLKSKLQGNFPKELERDVNRLRKQFEAKEELDKRLLQKELSPRNEIKTQAPRNGKLTKSEQDKKMRRYYLNADSDLFLEFAMDDKVDNPQGMQYICDEDGKVVEIIAEYFVIEKSGKGEFPSRNTPFLNTIKLSLGKGLTESLSAKKIGEISLKGIDGKSLIAVAKREDAGKQKCSNDSKNIDSSKGEK